MFPFEYVYALIIYVIEVRQIGKARNMLTSKHTQKKGLS